MSGSSNWWMGFFSDLWLEVQATRKSHELTMREVDFLTQTLNLSTGSRILDAPCGVGRHSIELARRGYTVTGVDITETFISWANEAAAKEQVAAKFIVNDMRAIDWDGAFHAVACLGGSFGYFDDADNAKFLRSAARALVPGGRLFLDTHVTETLLPRMNEPRVWEAVNDVLMLQYRAFDHHTSRTNTQWTLIRGEHRYTNNTSIRLYSYRELHELIEASGLTVQHIYGGLDGREFDRRADRAFAIAGKS